MAKRSSVQVTATVTGDGLNLVNAPAPTVNAATAPDGGLQLIGPFTGRLTIAPPSTATVGCFITPDAGCAGGSIGQVGGVEAGVLIAVNLTTFLSLVAPSAGFDMTVPGPAGSVLVHWV